MHNSTECEKKNHNSQLAITSSSSSSSNSSVSSPKLTTGRKMFARNARFLGLALAACLLAMVLVLFEPPVVRAEEEQLTVASRQQKEALASENELADTINYLQKLEKLDEYWSERARPRFGRSAYKQPVTGMRLGSDQPGQRQLPSLRQIRLVNEPRVGSLVELINARLAAQKYNSNEAY